MNKRIIFFNGRSVVMPLVVANVIIFILQIILGDSFTASFMLKPDVFTRPWILLTHMFLHGSFVHLFFNMYALLMFGSIVESRIGKNRFLLVYLLSGLIAGFISSFFYSSALGASGAIMGILGILIVINPNLQVLFFFFIPMSLRTAGIIWALMDIFGLFYSTGVGNIAHLVGLGVGLIFGKTLKKEKKTFNKKFSSKSHLDSDDIDEYLRSGRI